MPNLTAFGLAGPYQPLDNSGAIVPGGFLWFFVTGTEDLKDTFADSNGNTPNANPVELDGNGRAVIFLDDDGAYDVAFYGPDVNNVPQTGTLFWTQTRYFPAAPVI